MRPFCCRLSSLRSFSAVPNSREGTALEEGVRSSGAAMMDASSASSAPSSSVPPSVVSSRAARYLHNRCRTPPLLQLQLRLRLRLATSELGSNLFTTAHLHLLACVHAL